MSSVMPSVALETNPEHFVRIHIKFLLHFKLLIELDDSGVIADDDEDPPEYADEGIEVTEEMMDAADEKRSAAMSAMSEGIYSKIVSIFENIYITARYVDCFGFTL